MNKLNAGTWLLGVAAGSFLTGIIVKSAVESNIKENARPTAASAISDLNQDGVTDMIVNTGYRKIPLYGVEKDSSIIYVSGDELLKLHPEPIIDYETIENRLNKQGGK